MKKSLERAIRVFIMRQEGLSYPEIGRRLDIWHTTAIAAYNRAKWMMQTDSDFWALVQEVKEQQSTP